MDRGRIDWKANDWIDCFPEKKDGKREFLLGYLVPINDTSAELIATFPGELVFEDDLSETTYKLMLASAIRQRQNAKRTAALKEYLACRSDCKIESVVATGFAPQIDATPDKYMMLYQRVAYDNSRTLPGHALFKEQGTGKTLVAIRRILFGALEKAEKDPDGPVYKAIIVCPNNVRSNWLKEFELFSQDLPVTYDACILKGTDVQRVGLLAKVLRKRPGKNLTIVVTSYDTLSASWDALQFVQWDLSVCDESQYIKSWRAKRTKVCMKLRDNSAARMALTGTPMDKPVDLYSQFEFLGQGYSGFSSIGPFRRFYSKVVVQEDGTRRLEGLQQIPVLKERIARLTTVLTKKECLPFLPPKSYDMRCVDATEEQWRIYRDVASRIAVEAEEALERAEGGSGAERKMVVNHVLTKLLRLAQITSGFVTWDPIMSDDGELLQPRTVDRLDPNPKLEELVCLIKESDEPERKWLVWACWTQDIKTISMRLRMEGYKVVTFFGDTKFQEREDNITAFNEDDTTRIWVGSQDSGGAGLNLLGYPIGRPHLSKMNCDHHIYFSQNWKAISRSQSEDRNHRRGTRVPVRITDLTMLGTIDEEIRERVWAKRMVSMGLTDVREILNLLAVNLELGS